jgi:hypothetical protein
MARKYSIPAPTGRSVTTWQNSDEKLVAMIRELEGIQRDLAPDDDLAAVLARMPEPVDRAEAITDLWIFLDEHPAYAELSHRAELDPDCDDDAAREVLLEDHPDDASFEAACRERLGDWDIHIALGAEPNYKERIARVMEASNAGKA